MSSKDTKHRKHTALVRPVFGEFHTQEWAILGAPCDLIQKLTASWLSVLGPEYPLAYVDAEHARGEEVPALTPAGAALIYTDRIGYQQLGYTHLRESFRRRVDFQSVSGVLINGNHFLGRRQIVLLDPRKKESLSRKLDRLTDVGLFLSVDGAPVYDFLKTHLPHWADIPRWDIDDTDRTVAWLRHALQKAVPPVKGLVLAGGKSTRMGTDKAALSYHGIPQWAHLTQLLSTRTSSVHLSLRPGQSVPTHETITPDPLPDTFTGLGPFGAILSAFRQDPTSAWLVIACDLPLLTPATLDQLLTTRDPGQYATAFHNPATGFPEPLITICEPRAYPLLLQYLAQGYSCPRKALINSPIRTVYLENPSVLLNANHPTERDQVIELLARKEA